MLSMATRQPWLLLLPLASAALAISLDCANIVADKQEFNFQKLDGPHTLYSLREHPPSVTNTTFTLDICRPLKKQKNVPKGEDCPNGSRVCAIENLVNKVENVSTIENTIPIAGEFSHTRGGALDPKFTRLRSSASTADREKEGVRIELNGGKYENTKQKAIIEFLCPSKSKAATRRDAAEDDDEDDGGSGPGSINPSEGHIVGDEHGGQIRYISWDQEEEARVLRLEWDTPYACEGASEGGSDGKNDGLSSGHWGFFTWFIIIIFMGVAAYLIFGSWLNYNRYSARGWDLIPHSETIRDLPYLLQDWVRRIFSTLQGGPSRAGYSAV